MVGAITIGEVAAIVAAVAWALLVLFLALVLVNVFRVLESTKILIDDIRGQTVPLLSEVTTTVSNVNRELDRADGLLESATKLARVGERVATVVEQAVTSPLIKMVGISAGAAAALKAFRRNGKERKG